MVAFDNDQVVGKSWRVSTDNKVKSSCYTGFVRKLDNIRNQDGNYFDEVYDTHYQMFLINILCTINLAIVFHGSAHLPRILKFI